MAPDLISRALEDLAGRQRQRAKRGLSPSTAGKTLLFRADDQRDLRFIPKALTEAGVIFYLVDSPLRSSRDLIGLFALSDVLVLDGVDESLANPFLPKVLATEVPVRGDLVVLSSLPEAAFRRMGFLTSSSSPVSYIGPVEFFDVSHGYTLRETARGWVSLPIFPSQRFGKH